MDFCYGFLTFHPTLALNIPGGLSFDLMQYWDGQPVRFVCCERQHGSDTPLGRLFWCVTIELEEEEKETSQETETLVGKKANQGSHISEPVNTASIKDDLGVD